MTQAELMAENEKLRAQIAALQARVEGLEAALKEALAQLEAQKRAGKRQAAPFARGKPKPDPKAPGRKKGHQAAHRPKPDQVNRVLDAPLKQSCCLACGGELGPRRVEVQYQVDIPPVEPVVTQFKIEVAQCIQCGQRAQGRHPEQTSEALGAAAVQIGPRAQGLAAEMKHALGVPYRKVCRVLSQGFDLSLSPGALVKGGQRLAKQAEPTYDQLLIALRQQEVVCGDETGWRLAADHAWLWVFTSEAVTVYTIDRRRSHEVAERVLGRDFGGVLSCDCFAAYDPLPYRQQKCLGHLLRRCDELTAPPQPAAASRLSRQVARLLRGAIRLKKGGSRFSPAQYQRGRQALETALDTLLTPPTEPDNEAARRLLKLLRKQRQRLFTFLEVAQVQPTNNAAERAIRPAVIVRKTSAGNRSQAGAKTHAIITSLWQTCQQQGRNFLDVVTTLLRQPEPAALELVPLPPVSTRTEG